MLKQVCAALASAAFLAACSAAEIAEPVVTTAAETGLPAGAPGDTATGESSLSRDAVGRPLGHALMGQKLPNFSAPLSTGGTFRSADIKRWTVIHVWGAWSSDSVADGTNADALRRAIDQDPDLDFVSIHVPESAELTSESEMFGEFGSLEAYFESAGFRFPVVLDADASVAAALRIDWTPTYLLVSPDGIVRSFRTDLSADRDQPVKNYIKDIARIRGEVRKSLLPTISAAGAMGVTGPTPFTLPAIEAAFPGLVVTSQVDSDVPVFHVSAPDAAGPRYIVEPDWSRGFVGRVRTSDPAVEGPNGLRTGQSRYSDLRQEAVVGCTPSGAGSDLKITCQSSNSLPSLQLDFKADGGGAPMLVEMSYLAAVPAP
jgi:AhpC/TSA family